MHTTARILENGELEVTKIVESTSTSVYSKKDLENKKTSLQQELVGTTDRLNAEIEEIDALLSSF